MADIITVENEDTEKVQGLNLWQSVQWLETGSKRDQ